MLEVSLYEDDYHITTIFTDQYTLEGIGSFVKLFSEISGNQRVSLKIAGSKFKPNKKYLYEKNIRRIPSKINSEMKYYVVARGSKSYNIYTFDDLRFLSGIYIGIGFCKEDYSYIIRGIGETDADINEKEEKEDEVEEIKIKKKNKGLKESIKVKNKEKDHEVERVKEKVKDKRVKEVIAAEEERNESIPEVKDEVKSESNDVDVDKKKESVDVDHHQVEKNLTDDDTEIKDKDISSSSQHLKEEDKEEQEAEVEQQIKNVVLTKRSPKIRLSPKRQSRKKVVNTPLNLSLMKIDDLKEYAKSENIDVEGLTKKTEFMDRIKEKLGSE